MSGNSTSVSGSGGTSGQSAETNITTPSSGGISTSGKIAETPGADSKPWRDQSYTPPEGRAGNLTPEHQKALDDFREELKKDEIFVEERMSDTYLLRFLRARKWDLVKAKEMITAAEQWRKTEDVDSLYTSFDFKEKEAVFEYYPQYYHKTDKEGRPLYIERLGRIKTDKLRQITSKERQLKQLIVEYERLLRDRLPACSEAAGHPIETSCTILDLKDVSLKEFYYVSDYVQAASKIGQDYYPETMGKFYLINTPWLIGTVWTVIEKWLDPVTREKIKMLKGQELAKLLEQVPAENLPSEFGGSCKCPQKCEFSNAGPWQTAGPPVSSGSA